MMPLSPAIASASPPITSCDVIIPVKNSPWWVDWCLAELFRCTASDALGRVIVVDDGSDPESAAVLRGICAKYERTSVAQNEARPGFGGACNHGVALSSAPALLFLNTDCLLTPRAIEKLLAAVNTDPKIGMACPLSNNSPVLTLPMFPGRSYRDMNDLVEAATAGLPWTEVAIDACTVVGNCLLITRECWDRTGEFDPVWGVGYGEETDFQFRAMERGFRGVVLINTYVFHFGSATFRHSADLAEIQKRALSLFHSRWGQRYAAYAECCRAREPLTLVTEHLRRMPDLGVALDVLFILPGVAKGIGGIHVVVDTCNHLVRQGVRAGIAVLGELDIEALRQFDEPLLFGLLHFPTETEMLSETAVAARIVVATLFTTSVPACGYAMAHGSRLVNWIQGFEFYFGNGVYWNDVEDAYAVADEFVVTSGWLRRGVQSRCDDRPVTHLPLGIDRNIFWPRAVSLSRGPKTRVGVVLRSAPDKGQWILIDVIERLAAHRDDLALTLFLAPPYARPRAWAACEDFRVVDLPLTREALAGHLRDCDILVDGSLHEGFGLIPLEAMACGATVVVSNSGGVTEFVRDGVNGVLVTATTDPDAYVRAVLDLATNSDKLDAFKAAAVRTSVEFDVERRMASYERFFRGRLTASCPRPAPEPLFSTGERDGYAGLTAESDLLMVTAPALALDPVGPDPNLFLPPLAGSADPLILRVQIASTIETDLEVFVPNQESRAVRVVRRAARILSSLGRSRVRTADRYDPARCVTRRLVAGRNDVLVGLPPLPSGGAIRLDPGFGQGKFLVEGVEVRAVPEQDVTGLEPHRLQALFGLSTDVRLVVDPATATDLVANESLQVERTMRGLTSIGSENCLVLPDIRANGGRPIVIEVDVSTAEPSPLRVVSRTGNQREIAVSRHLKAGRNRMLFLLNEPDVAGRAKLEFGGRTRELVIHSLRLWALDRPGVSVPTGERATSPAPLGASNAS